MRLSPNRAGLLLACTLSAVLNVATAAPYTPAADDEVVETLRQRPLDAQERAAQAQRQQARHQPNDLALALRVARNAIDRARLEGDPRELGQAQAALTPWWTQAEPPPAVRLMRATVLQSRHEFTAALADLDRLVASAAPVELRAQAELTRASVLQVQGRYGDAADACERLLSTRYQALGAAAELPARVCLAELASLRGRPAEARTALDKLAAQARPQEAGWLALVRAELAERLGDDRQAEALYHEALAAAGDTADVYTLAAYADWLLGQQRSSDVAALLGSRPQADALLLRLACAWRQAGDSRAYEAANELKQRFEATRQRGDTPHLREEAYAALRLQGDATRALRLALDNWAQQKEPADARLLAEAAQAAGRPEAALPVREFMRESGYVDVRVARWLP